MCVFSTCVEFRVSKLIFICLSILVAKTQKDEKSNPEPAQTASLKKKEAKSSSSQPAVISSPMILPLNFTVNATAPSVRTVTPQPVIVNNQVLFVRKYCLPCVSEVC